MDSSVNMTLQMTSTKDLGKKWPHFASSSPDRFHIKRSPSDSHLIGWKDWMDFPETEKAKGAFFFFFARPTATSALRQLSF